MLNVADVLEFVVDGLDECPFPEQYLVVLNKEGLLFVFLIIKSASFLTYKIKKTCIFIKDFYKLLNTNK